MINIRLGYICLKKLSQKYDIWKYLELQVEMWSEKKVLVEYLLRILFGCTICVRIFYTNFQLDIAIYLFLKKFIKSSLYVGITCLNYCKSQ